MAVEIEMPQLSSEGESATLASWLVEPGDIVEKGDVIAELETDKATVELEAPASGAIAELRVSAGTEDIGPGTVLGLIEASDAGVEDSGEPGEPHGDSDASLDEGEPEDQAADDRESEGHAAEDREAVSQPAARTEQLESGASTERAATARRGPTPLARRVADEHGVDVRELEGSGPGGRIVEADVRQAAGAPAAETSRSEPAPTDSAASGSTPASKAASKASRASMEASDPALELDPPFESRRLTSMRRTIARRLREAKQTIPHFYLRMRCSMDALLEARARLNESLEERPDGVKLSLNDFILKATALALREVPAANVSFADDAIRFYERVDLSVAVATEGGLVTPIVRDADRKGLARLAAETKELAALARAGKLRPEQFQGGTFTVSNLGMYGIETVYPIVNPPQAGILGVGAVETQPIVRGGEVVVGRMAAFTLAADHRVVDGAIGAQLMAALRSRLEDPAGMLL